MTQLVIKLLANRSPPSCVRENILTVANTLLPNYEVIDQLPSLDFVRKSRGTLSYLTKLLAADLLARTPVWLENHTDGTSLRQVHIGNNLVRIASGAGYKTICLDNAILSVDESSECVRDGVVRSFTQGAAMLDQWRVITAKLYPGRQDLLDRIPQAAQLSMAKLAKNGWIMTDTCHAATKFMRLFVESIIQVAKDEGLPAREIKVYQAGEFLPFKQLFNSFYNIRLTLVIAFQIAGNTCVIFGLAQ